MKKVSSSVLLNIERKTSEEEERAGRRCVPSPRVLSYQPVLAATLDSSRGSGIREGPLHDSRHGNVAQVDDSRVELVVFTLLTIAVDRLEADRTSESHAPLQPIGDVAVGAVLAGRVIAILGQAPPVVVVVDQPHDVSHATHRKIREVPEHDQDGQEDCSTDRKLERHKLKDRAEYSREIEHTTGDKHRDDDRKRDDDADRDSHPLGLDVTRSGVDTHCNGEPPGGTNDSGRSAKPVGDQTVERHHRRRHHVHDLAARDGDTILVLHDALSFEVAKEPKRVPERDPDSLEQVDVPSEPLEGVTVVLAALGGLLVSRRLSRHRSRGRSIRRRGGGSRGFLAHGFLLGMGCGDCELTR